MRALMKKIREEDAAAAAASASVREKENMPTSKVQTEGESMLALMKTIGGNDGAASMEKQGKQDSFSEQ
eukprot:CAMPEP_0183768448 /NCGR_PEP_ID=MMETSP0739-20130205/16759_1 /TAXON_ID=385413 /ORGANISM="Thalassiosira miniscula, Strain CCMP1093" /LENGTH=68 /DNA_ID=CAMNT_0026007689 /DNA_START=6 /DNA_END=210 /DNA_ORIENTATION=-